MPRRRSLLCLALLFLPSLGCHPGAGGSSSVGKGRPPVIVISVDTLRADHLPMYGYRGVETPALDQLRKDSILYSNAYSHVPLTLPSHLTMLTGQLPQDHGVRDNVGYEFDPAKHLTIPGLLKQNGYATGAAVSAYVLRGSTGIGPAFDFFDDRIAAIPGVTIGNLARPGYDTIASAEPWIAAHDSEPFFFFLHLFEPHTPYEPAEAFRARYASNPYDGEIATADDIVGKFLADLKQRGIYDKALIVFMSDHGEGLMDHGEQEHGILLYRNTIHVPLLVKLPGSALAGKQVETPVQLIDIFPTIARYVTGSVPSGLTGKSLIDLAQSAVDRDRRVFSETLYPRIHLGWSELRSMAGDRYQYIAAPHPELYDFSSDPAERNNVLTDQRRVYTVLKKELDAFGTSVAAPAEVDPEEAKKLAALGYINATRPTMSGDLPDPKEHIAELEQLRHAYLLDSQHRIPEAIAALQAVLAKNPGWRDSWIKLAQVYEESGDFEKAAATYKKAITEAPTLASELGLSLAAIEQKLGRYDEAAANAELAMTSNPGGAHEGLGQIALARGDLPKARSEAEQAARFPGQEFEAGLLIAQVEETEGNLPDALTTLDSLKKKLAAARSRPLPNLEFFRGDVLARMNRNAEAERAFLQEIQDFPLNRQAYANLAVLYILEKKPGDAHALLEEMAKASPGSKTDLFAARTLETMGDHAGAAMWKQRAGKSGSAE